MIFSWKENADSWLEWCGTNSDAKPKFKICGELLHKTHPNKLNLDWQNKMRQVLEVWVPPGFQFIDNGYIIKFINGTDLHGNPVFVYNNDLDGRCNYPHRYLESILDIYNTVENINSTLGFTFADVSPSNIILDPLSNRAYLVDLDDIAPIVGDQRVVFQSNRDLIFNKNIATT